MNVCNCAQVFALFSYFLHLWIFLFSSPTSQKVNYFSLPVSLLLILLLGAQGVRKCTQTTSVFL